MTPFQQGVFVGWFLGSCTFLGLAVWVTLQANRRKQARGVGPWSPTTQKRFKPAVDRLIGLVQDHSDWFDAGIGDSCLNAAADKLEALIGE